MQYDEPIARKLYSSHPDDSYLTVVLHTNQKGEFVTHLHNATTDGFSSGHYFQTLEEAMKDFDQRGVPTDKN